MKKIIFIFFAILIASCSSFTSTSTHKEVDLFVGKEGLAMEFSKVAPPETVFENTQFPVLMKVRNLGAQDISLNSGVISIGTEKDYVSINKLE